MSDTNRNTVQFFVKFDEYGQFEWHEIDYLGKCVISSKGNNDLDLKGVFEMLEKVYEAGKNGETLDFITFTID